MVHENNSAQHVERYKMFLTLYPKSYRERFAEPMLQMFIDMLNEHIKTGDPTWSFVLRIYLDTAKEIIIEHSKELAVNVKTQRTRAYIGGGMIGVLIITIIGVSVFSSRNSGTIPLYSTVEEARALSKGEKDKCLPDNQLAIDAIKKDDTIEEIEYEGQITQFSSFETTAVSGFRDIPAGTNGEVTKNQYDGEVASGSIIYEQDYGTYNYSVKNLPNPGEWELVSLSSCDI